MGNVSEKCSASNGDCCWHGHGNANWASTDGSGESHYHCCYCGKTKVVRTHATTMTEQIHGPYLMWCAP